MANDCPICNDGDTCPGRHLLFDAVTMTVADVPEFLATVSPDVRAALTAPHADDGAGDGEAPCYCGEINSRHCPRHNDLPSAPERDARGKSEYITTETLAVYACPGCAFTFDAAHVCEDGSYLCPVCEEVRLTMLVAKLDAEIARLRTLVGANGGFDAHGDPSPPTSPRWMRPVRRRCSPASRPRGNGPRMRTAPRLLPRSRSRNEPDLEA